MSVVYTLLIYTMVDESLEKNSFIRFPSRFRRDIISHLIYKISPLRVGHTKATIHLCYLRRDDAQLESVSIMHIDVGNTTRLLICQTNKINRFSADT